MGEQTRKNEGGRSRSAALTWLWPTIAASLGVCLTIVGVAFEYQRVGRANRLHFESLSERIRAEVVRRVGVYHYGLMGSRSVFAASKSVERGEFREMVQSRNMTTEFPGALGIGYIERVKRSNLEDYLKHIRGDEMPDFQVKTSGNADELYVTEYIEPIETNREVLGYDIMQEPARREAAERAMLTGDAALTGRLKLFTSPDIGPGFHYYLPVYRNGVKPQTPEQRREALVGWVFMRMSARQILAGVTQVTDREVDFEAFDGEKLDMSNLLYDDDGHLSGASGEVAGSYFIPRGLYKSVQVHIGGRLWTVMMSATPDFKSESYFAAAGIGVAGTLLSLAVASILYTLGVTARRAKALAEGMTADLQRLALVAQKTTNAVILADVNGKIVWANNGLAKITGYSPDEPIGLTLSEFLLAEKTPNDSATTIRDALRAGKGCRTELYFRGKAGRECVLDIDIQALRNSNDALTGFIVVETDVTEQVVQRNQLSSIFKTMTEGLVVVACDGTIINCNPEAERMLGVTLDEVAGRSVREVEWRATHENGEPWPVETHPAMITLKTGEPIRNAVMGVESVRGGFRWLSTNTQAMRSADGTIEAAVACLSDITGYVRSRDELDRKERTLRGMIDKSRQLAGILTPEGRIVEVNQTALDFIGVKDKAMVIDQFFWDSPWWSHSAELQLWVRGAVARAARGEHVRRELSAPDRTGALHEIDFSITPVLNANGNVMLLIPEGFDITQSKLAAAELREARDAAHSATRSKSEFLANMSHEIRTPMTAILGYTDLLAEEWDTGLSAKHRLDYINTIKRNGEHLLTIINDILDLSKIEAGKMTVESIETDPDQVVHEVLSLMHVKAQGKGIGLEAFHQTAVPTRILSDPLRLRQILLNLVGNAIKFTEAGKVTISTSLEHDAPGGPYLKFQITDTGIGMSPAQVNGLFSAFDQADTSTTRKFGGTGLGLIISQRLAEMLGGDITASSEPGEGSVFTLMLATGPLEGVPLLPAGKSLHVVRERSEKTTAPIAPVLNGSWILMVEDGPDNRRLVSLHLRRAGAEVLTAENGEMAVTALTDNGQLDGALRDPLPINLILMDMQMPKMDGYTATRVLRSKGLKIPIIALTAHAMAGDAEKCLEAGCDAYITKPIDRDKLISLCELWVSKDQHPVIAMMVEEDDAPASTPTAPTESENPFLNDPAMMSMVREFVSSFPGRVKDMESFLADGKFEAMVGIAHQLAGSAGSFGYPKITNAARRVEHLWRGHAGERAVADAAIELLELCRSAHDSLNKRA